MNTKTKIVRGQWAPKINFSTINFVISFDFNFLSKLPSYTNRDSNQGAEGLLCSFTNYL